MSTNTLTQQTSQHPPQAETLATRIQKLLGQNLPASIVASTVGCDTSYISQLMENEEYKNTVLLLRAGKAEGAVARDSTWDNVEDMALKRAVEMLPLVSRPSDLIRIASLANAAKRRAAEYAGINETTTPTVNLVLPQGAVIHFQMNSNAQVVEVDGRSMAALPTKVLTEQMAARKAARDTAGVVDVLPVTPVAPALTNNPAPSLAQLTERKKVVSILEQIGYSDEAVPVQKVLP